MSFLTTPLADLPGLGTKRAQLIAEELDLHTYRDLLYYIPYRYADRRVIYPIGSLMPSMSEVQVEGILQPFSAPSLGRKSSLSARLMDDTGELLLVWFKGYNYIQRSLTPGCKYIVYGKLQLFNNQLQITHPEIKPADKPNPSVGGYQPIYRTTERLKRARIDSAFLGRYIDQLLQSPYFSIPETLSEPLIAHRHLAPLQTAIRWIHHPQSVEQAQVAKFRLKYDELFYLNLYLRRLAVMQRMRYEGYRLDQVGKLFNGLYHALPYDLTGAQKRVLREIRQDTLSGTQMNRLIQGDVGSGKTLVALFAMLLAVDNGYQACMLAPTEILAQQHYETISEFVEGLNVSIALLTGSSKTRERRETLSALADGSLSILIGTHAILEERVAFRKLGMAVIDEQHRFGVAQRSKLWGKNVLTLPHILVMSATPIPRTLAMTMYGDLEVSVIDEMPPGRKPITTVQIAEKKKETLYSLINETINRGQQIYVVFPMIEGTEESDFANLEVGYKEYVERFGEQRVVYVHGRLSAEDKAEQMERFASGEVPILLATTVIEVGVNVPNATVMVINDAQRFGLAQLHQLRGRVGRGGDKSYCILVTPDDLQGDAKQRIDTMVATQDGFKIAEEDMRLRGFGQMEGTRQSGTLAGIRIADPVADYNLLALTRLDVNYLLDYSPLLDKPDTELYRINLERIHPNAHHWGQIS
ncbi:ATP-dependent DNA helicase RecG [uncultured Porphyromonas sp.]|uniref:ATP-dependent DNA helicase RecG n=1 Tax=uncultured Porphyromonas sp. TaxID=159274 RepID=UPI002610B59C|nr:ATP-dependent DNA helicase RecG [uncultured Porphyromonas sp.]